MGKSQSPQSISFIRRDSIVPTPPDDPMWSIQAHMPNGISITSQKFYPSSEFIYPSLLSAHGIGITEWHQFTSVIQALAKWDGAEASHVKSNIGLFVFAAVFVAAWPVFAVLGRKYYKDKRAALEHSNITSRQIILDNGQLANLSQVVEHYDKNLFAPHGLMVKMSVPSHSDSLKINGPGNRVTILIAPIPGHVHQNTEQTGPRPPSPLTPNRFLSVEQQHRGATTA